ncbi:MarR family winged helix-turn-helix transcriptional regulator [Desulfoplanes sp. PS50]|jgi:DNA-binding MarR family transcriptional regulator
MHDVEVFSDRVIEFYDKLSSWEQGVVRGGAITLQQTHILEVLGRFAPLRMKELATRTGVTTGTLTVAVDRLEKMGLVTRSPHARDRRSILVELTETGQGLYHEHHRHHLRLAADMLDVLTPQEAEAFGRIVEKLGTVL